MKLPHTRKLLNLTGLTLRRLIHLQAAAKKELFNLKLSTKKKLLNLKQPPANENELQEKNSENKRSRSQYVYHGNFLSLSLTYIHL